LAAKKNVTRRYSKKSTVADVESKPSMAEKKETNRDIPTVE